MPTHACQTLRSITGTSMQVQIALCNKLEVADVSNVSTLLDVSIIDVKNERRILGRIPVNTANHNNLVKLAVYPNDYAMLVILSAAIRKLLLLLTGMATVEHFFVYELGNDQ
jgi:hypothetical protein